MITKDKTIAVIGLGFVGLPLATHFALRGYQVKGFDKDEGKVNDINNGKSYIGDVKSNLLHNLVNSGNFLASLPNKSIYHADYIIVTVPTPVSEDHMEPDLSSVTSASRFIASHLRKGQTIIFESSTYPGTLEEVVLPILSKTGLVVGVDFFVGYSPERIDPGNDQYSLKDIPKVISGQTKRCLARVWKLYSTVFDQVVPVSSPKVAEMCKLFENIQRLVNISLVNEMEFLCHKMNIDFREAIQAASTKPFGFTPYWPGPGIGGHCIPVDPIYFQWKMKQYGFSSRLIDQAHQINQEMPANIVERLYTELSSRGRRLQKEKPILLIGLTYKKDVNDVRESPALEIFKLLLKDGYKVEYVDPYIPSIAINGKTYQSKDLTQELLSEVNGVIILTDHSNIQWNLLNHADPVVDTRGIMASVGKVV